MKIAEDFYSVQGEGTSQGIPSYFIRLGGCNLMCGGTHAKFVKNGTASWWCDTEDVWKNPVVRNNEDSYKYLIDRFQEAGQLERILDGLTRVIWTGGEPLLSGNALDIELFNKQLSKNYHGNNVYAEVETNGTILMSQGWYQRNIKQINCSPKLKNSGLPAVARINIDALEQINEYKNSQFKFVISSEDDIKEIREDFIYPSNISEDKIILMPACDNYKDLPSATKLCYDLTKKYGYRTISRGQVLAWDKTTGV